MMFNMLSLRYWWIMVIQGYPTNFVILLSALALARGQKSEGVMATTRGGGAGAGGFKPPASRTL